MRERLHNLFLLCKLLPMLMASAAQRQLLAEMMRFLRELPAIMKRPLPDAMRMVAALPVPVRLPEKRLRELADLAAALERRSVPGICLKRSLIRYRYLSAIDVPLEVVFGVRFKDVKQAQRQIAGHAWLEQDGVVYFESAENTTPFKPIFRWPITKAVGS